MKYGIAIFPSKEIQDKANSYRKRYDPHYALIPPHITLKEPFEVHSDQADDIVKYLKEVAKNTSPFPLKVKKVSSFQPVNYTIYFKVEPVEELIALNQKLHEGVLPNEQTYSYVPHITIAQKLSHSEHSDIYGTLRMMDIEFEEKVNRFQLLYQLENGSWSVYETFVLGEG